MSNSQEPRVNPSTTAKKPGQVQTEKGEPAKREYRWIPTSWEAASPEDKMLVTMREAGGSWSTIQIKWEDLTGTEVGASTLPRRYNRIIANCAHLAEGDVRGDTGNSSAAEDDVKKNPEKLERQVAFNRGRKGYLPPYIQADASDGERPVREAVIGAYLDAVNEAVVEALSDQGNENVDG